LLRTPNSPYYEINPSGQVPYLVDARGASVILPMAAHSSPPGCGRCRTGRYAGDGPAV